LLLVKKGDFFLLFWSAWSKVFSNKPLILKSFEATGVWPKNRQVVLQRFDEKTAGKREEPEQASAIPPNDWIALERLLRSAVADVSSLETKELSEKLHHYQVENDLLNNECQGLRNALKTKKKHKKKGRALDLQQHEEYHGGAVFWTPRAFREARYRESVRGAEEKRLQLQKADAKKLREQNKLLNMKLKEEKRVAAEQRKVKREEKKAEVAAKRARKLEERNTKAAQNPAQIGKRKASQSSYPKAKRVRRSGDDRDGAVGKVAAPAPAPKVTTRGRAIKLPTKYN
jgi:hypothetical protein